MGRSDSLTSCPPLAPSSSGLSKCPQPSALVRRSARDPLGGSHTLHPTRPQVSLRGPGRRPRWAGDPVQPFWLLSAHTCSAVGKRHVSGRPAPWGWQPAWKCRHRRGPRAGCVCRVCPCLNVARLTGAWLVGLSTAREPGAARRVVCPGSDPPSRPAADHRRPRQDRPGRLEVQHAAEALWGRQQRGPVVLAGGGDLR